MKRLGRFFFLLLLLPVLLVLPAAAEEADTEQIYDEQLEASGADELIDMLPEETRRFMEELGITSLQPEGLTGLAPQNVLESLLGLLGEQAGTPLAACGVVLGIVLLCSVALSLVFVLIVALYGQVYPQELAVGYLGFILQGCAFIALDMLISAQCRAPMTAAIVAFGGNLLLWLMDVLNAAIDIKIVNSILTFISPYQRCAPFKLGQLSFANALYFVAAIFLCLFFSVRTLDARRWREA